MDTLLYNLSSSLEQFKGENGMNRLLQASKLSLLSFIGDFEKTRDTLFERRSASIESTRACILQLNEEFTQIEKLAEKLSVRVNTVASIMHQFHRHCDLEIDALSSSDARGGNAAPVRGDPLHAARFSNFFKDLQNLNAQLQGIATEFSAAGETSKRLNTASLQQLEAAHLLAKGRVKSRQTELDVLRRSVQVKESHLASRDPYSSERRLGEFNLNRVSAKLQEVGNAYIHELEDAMRATQFSMEQAAMTGWASCNVFFRSLSVFLKDSSATSERIAEQYNHIKNEQAVSKAITSEKRGAAAAAGRTPTGQAPQQSPSGPGKTVDTMDDLFAPIEPTNPVADGPNTNQSRSSFGPNNNNNSGGGGGNVRPISVISVTPTGNSSSGNGMSPQWNSEKTWNVPGASNAPFTASAVGSANYNNSNVANAGAPQWGGGASNTWNPPAQGGGGGQPAWGSPVGYGMNNNMNMNMSMNNNNNNLQTEFSGSNQTAPQPPTMANHWSPQNNNNNNNNNNNPNNRHVDIDDLFH